MIKKIILLIIFIFISLNINAQTSILNGNWSNNSIWNTGNAPNYSFNTTVNIHSNIISDNDIEVLFGGILNIGNNDIINDTLRINGELLSALFTTVNVLQDGVLIIMEDLYNVILGDIYVDGELLVHGNFYNDGSSYINVSEYGIITVDSLFYNDGFVINDGTIISDSTAGNGIIVGNDPLPIELIYFKGENFNYYNRLEWATNSEINNDYFLIEYSTGGFNWNKLTTINGFGNSTTIRKYKYDHYTNNSLYYRLTQFDFDGKYEIFNIIFIETPHINKNIEYDIYDIYGRFINKMKYDDINLNGLFILKNNNETKKVYFNKY